MRSLETTPARLPHLFFFVWQWRNFDSTSPPTRVALERFGSIKYCRNNSWHTMIFMLSALVWSSVLLRRESVTDLVAWGQKESKAVQFDISEAFHTVAMSITAIVTILRSMIILLFVMMTMVMMMTMTRMNKWRYWRVISKGAQATYEPRQLNGAPPINSALWSRSHKSWWWWRR